MVAVATATSALTPRWYPLRFHAGQCGFFLSEARFNLVEGGRRGGKSEIGRRRIFRKALSHHRRCSFPDGFYPICAPTRDQVKHIHWETCKQMAPTKFIRRISESELWIDWINGARLQLVGMDKPARIEGGVIDHALCDEFHEWRPGSWAQTMEPALATEGRDGSADVVGIARFSRQMKKLADLAKSGAPGWRYHHWTSEGIVSEEKLEQARRSMDDHEFRQEFMAQRVELAGRAYYAMDRAVHAKEPLRERYDRAAPLEICLDFNVSPGTAAIGQRILFRDRVNPRSDRPEVADEIDAWLGEVWIPNGSNTPRVMQRIFDDWGTHAGRVIFWGDPTGGNRGTAKVAGSDWDIVEDLARRHWGPGKVQVRVKRGAAKGSHERSRINALNARLRSADGKVHTLFDPKGCPHLIEDVDETMVLDGTNGELDKDSDPMRTHLSDGIGYRAEYEFGLGAAEFATTELR